MQVRLNISKDGNTLYESTCDVSDAASFGIACADAWMKLREQNLARASSIGALMEQLDDSVLDQLKGAAIRLDMV